MPDLLALADLGWRRDPQHMDAVILCARPLNPAQDSMYDT